VVEFFHGGGARHASSRFLPGSCAQMDRVPSTDSTRVPSTLHVAAGHTKRRNIPTRRRRALALPGRSAMAASRSSGSVRPSLSSITRWHLVATGGQELKRCRAAAVVAVGASRYSPLPPHGTRHRPSSSRRARIRRLPRAARDPSVPPTATDSEPRGANGTAGAAGATSHLASPARPQLTSSSPPHHTTHVPSLATAINGAARAAPGSKSRRPSIAAMARERGVALSMRQLSIVLK